MGVGAGVSQWQVTSAKSAVTWDRDGAVIQNKIISHYVVLNSILFHLSSNIKVNTIPKFKPILGQHYCYSQNSSKNYAEIGQAKQAKNFLKISKNSELYFFIELNFHFKGIIAFISRNLRGWNKSEVKKLGREKKQIRYVLLFRFFFTPESKIRAFVSEESLIFFIGHKKKKKILIGMELRKKYVSVTSLNTFPKPERFIIFYLSFLTLT